MDYGTIFDNILDAFDAGGSPLDDAMALLPGFLAEQPVPAQAYARALRDRAEARCVEAARAGDARTALDCANFYEDCALLMAPHDLDAYMLYMEIGREPAKRFYHPRRSILLPAVVRHLQMVGDGRLDLLAISMPPRTGKALAFDTPVLTRRGWKAHGDLTVRDEVAAPDGTFVPVLAIHEPCEMQYAVTFTNGERIVCHGEHEWRVYDRASGKVRDLSVNEMLAGKIEYGPEEGRGHRYRYMLPLREPIAGEERELPVGPYTLGAWLGDGRNGNPDICGAEADRPIVDAILAEGYELAWETRHKRTGVMYYGIRGLREQLQSVGMCHSRRTVPKRIPDAYFSASLDQRLELLAGLLDTDGTLRRDENRYTFSTAEPGLRDDFVRLVSTFGWRCGTVEYAPSEHGGICGRRPTYAVSFNPTLPVPCRLERKRLAALSPQRRVAVASIEPVSGAMGNCITVAGGMYLAGDTLVPTHNSTCGIFFMTWIMGRDPLSANVMSGHSTTLTEGFYKEALSIISDDHTYRFSRVFPDAVLTETSAKSLEISLRRKGRFPTLTARSIGSTLTGAVEVGRRGVLYVDDVVEDREQALSRQRMDKLYAAYLNQLKDRKLAGAREVHVATRWCPDDVIGRLKELYAGDPRKRFVSVPAVDADGRSNFVYERGLGFDDAYYADMRRSLEEAGEGDSWRAKYMGTPEYVGGLMFPAEELRRYAALPAGEPDAVVCACDTKDKGSDFCAMPVGAVYGDDVYIIDAVLDDSLPKLYMPRLVDCIVRNRVQRARFESNAAGGVIADQVEEACAQAGWVPKMVKVYSTTNKETRILADSDWIVANCLFPAEPPTRDLARFVAQLCSYTTEGKNPHDDAPDSMSMLKRLVCSMRTAKVEAVSRIA